MYENGKRINRYAAQQYHRKELKRRHTPKWYSSYEIYASCSKERDELLEALYPCLKSKPGQKSYWECWWKGYSGIYNPSWKKNLKKDDHQKCRTYYKQKCHEALVTADEDFVIPRTAKFGDSWDWI